MQLLSKTENHKTLIKFKWHFDKQIITLIRHNSTAEEHIN